MARDAKRQSLARQFARRLRSTPAAPEALDISRQLSALEDGFAARLGVSAVDLGTGGTVSYRDDERFRFASTVKVLTAAEFLRRTPPPERAARVEWTQNDVDRADTPP